MGDLPRNNKHKTLISDTGILSTNKNYLENSFQSRTKIKANLNMLASTRIVSRALKRLVEPRNCIKRIKLC